MAASLKDRLRQRHRRKVLPVVDGQARDLDDEPCRWWELVTEPTSCTQERPVSEKPLRTATENERESHTTCDTCRHFQRSEMDEVCWKHQMSVGPLWAWEATCGDHEVKKPPIYRRKLRRKTKR
jgi:hypothetical protein